jgi:hypothetical protein
MKLWARLSSILDARLVRLEEAVRSGKKEDESRDQRTSYALSWIVLASAIGLFASAAYGISFSSRGAILALLASILGYAAGGLLGFLFGFPRYTENAPVQSADDLKAAARGQDAAAASKGLNANTNLERIVDWLMTIIVGATLVNIGDMVTWGKRAFRLLTEVVQAVPPEQLAMAANASTKVQLVTTIANPVPGALLVLPFMVAGFLHLYLWARRYLLGEWSAAEREVRRMVTETVREAEKRVAEKVQEVDTDIATLKKQGSWPVEVEKLENLSNVLRSSGVSSDLVDDIIERYRRSDKWDSEPFADFAESSLEPFQLSAQARRSETRNRFAVRLSVKRTDGGSLDYGVYYLLHNSYDDPLVPAIPGARAAEGHVVYCDEGYIVAALVVEKSSDPAKPTVTKLALDLVEVIRKAKQ